MIETDKIVFAEFASMLAAGQELDPQQEAILAHLLEKYPNGHTYLRDIIESGKVETPVDPRRIDVYEEWLRFNVSTPVNPDTSIGFRSSWRIYTAVAAAVICVLLFAILWFVRSGRPDYIIEDKLYGQKNDVLPNDEQAIFEVDGKLFKKLGSDDLGKIPDSTNKMSRRQKVITPIRSSYAIVLFDGSKVWLSPESEVEYLSTFSSHERKVKLRGEAFFEIARDTSRPFIVEVDGLEIRALGTAFSVKNYNKEEPQVLLTEGRLQLITPDSERIIEAGYQADVVAGKLHAGVSTHLEDALGIKEGFFNFNNKDITTILTEIKRWYGVRLEIDREVEKKRYSGSIERNVTLAKVCSVLKDLTGYQYIIDGDKLIVL